MKDRLNKIIYEALKGNYYCDRVWDAWHYGTMTEDDFYPLEDSEDMIDELVCDITKLFEQENKKLREIVLKMYENRFEPDKLCIYKYKALSQTK